MEHNAGVGQREKNILGIPLFDYFFLLAPYDHPLSHTVLAITAFYSSHTLPHHRISCSPPLFSLNPKIQYKMSTDLKILISEESPKIISLTVHAMALWVAYQYFYRKTFTKLTMVTLSLQSSPLQLVFYNHPLKTQLFVFFSLTASRPHSWSFMCSLSLQCTRKYRQGPVFSL